MFATTTVLQLYCPNWTSPMGNSGCFSRGKPVATESRYPTYGACRVFWCFDNPPNSDMDYGIFNMRTYVNAYNCTKGCTDIVRESKLKVDWEKNPLPHRGIEPASAACRSDDLPTEPHPHSTHLFDNKLCPKQEMGEGGIQISERWTDH